MIGLPVARVIQLRQLLDDPVSLETPVGEGDSQFSDLVEDRTPSRPEQVAAEQMKLDELREALDGAAGPHARRDRAALRPGRLSRCTLEQVGEALGVTRERVRQIEARALRELAQRNPHLRLQLESSV